MRYTKEQLDKLEDALKQFYNDKEQAIAEIQKEKEAIQSLKTELLNSLIDDCHYIRDNQRLVISAPEIIIGNVDKHGILLSNAKTKITIKAHEISNEGISSAENPGTITNRATYLYNIAVNPGIDGYQNVVEERSQIAFQAKEINLEAVKDRTYFCKPTSTVSGISILTNSKIDLQTVEPIETQKQRLTAEKTKLEKIIDSVEGPMNENEKKLHSDLIDVNEVDENGNNILQPTLLKTMNDSYLYDEKLTGHHFNIRLHREKIDQQRKSFETAAGNYYRTCLRNYDEIAQYAEAKRVLKEVEQDLKELNGKQEATKTDTSVSINSESIALSTYDTQGNLSKINNQVSIYTKDFRVDARDPNKAVIDGSKILLAGERVKVDTSSHIDDHKSKEVGGSFYVISEDMTFEAVNHKLTKQDNKEGTSYKRGEEIKTTGNFFVRVKNINLDTTDKDYKPTKESYCIINSGNVYVGGLDYQINENEANANKITFEQINQHSKTYLLSNSIEIGKGKFGNKDSESFIPQTFTSKTKEGMLFYTKEKAIQLKTDSNKTTFEISSNRIIGDAKEVITNGNFIVTDTLTAKDIKATCSCNAPEITVENKFTAPNISASQPGIPGQAPNKVSIQKMKDEESEEPDIIYYDEDFEYIN